MARSNAARRPARAAALAGSLALCAGGACSAARTEPVGGAATASPRAPRAQPIASGANPGDARHDADAGAADGGESAPAHPPGEILFKTDVTGGYRGFVSGLAVDGAGDIAVTGSYEGIAGVKSAHLPAGQRDDVFVAKLSP